MADIVDPFAQPKATSIVDPFKGSTEGTTATSKGIIDPFKSEETAGDTLKAKVTKVLDGDTAEVTYPDGTTAHVRLSNIDAPEIAHDKRGAQKGGDEAAKYLSDRVLGKDVTLGNLGADPYGRTVANMSVNGKDVGQEMLDQKISDPYGKERTFMEKLTGKEVTPKEWRDEGKADADGRYSWDRLKKLPISAVAGTVASAVDVLTGLPEWASKTALTGAGMVGVTYEDIKAGKTPGTEESLKHAEAFADKYTKEFHMDALTGLAGRAATAMGADPTMIGHAGDPVSELYQAGQDSLAEQGSKVGIAPAATRFAMDNIVAMLMPEAAGKAHELAGKALGEPSPKYVDEYRARKEEQYAKAEKKASVEVFDENGKPLKVEAKSYDEVGATGLTRNNIESILNTDEKKEAFQKARQDYLKNAGDTEQKRAPEQVQHDATLAGLRSVADDHVIAGLRKENLDKKAASDRYVNSLTKDKTEPKEVDKGSLLTKQPGTKTPEEARKAASDRYLKSIGADPMVAREHIVNVATDAHIQRIGKAFDIPEMLLDNKGRKLEAPKDLGLEKLPGVVEEKPSKYAEWAENLKDQLGVLVRGEIKDGLMTHFDALKMEEILPDKAGRERVWEAIQEGKGSELTGMAKKLYDFHQKVMDEIYQSANKVGVIKGYINDYAARHIDMEHLTPDQKEAVMKEIGNAYPALQPTTKHGKTRTVTDFGELKKIMEKHDLKFKTTDLAEVFRLYAESVKRAIRDTNKLEAMKKTRVSGLPVLMEIGGHEKIPPNYKPLKGSGMFENYAVHPDMYDAAKFLIGSNNPGLILKAAATLSGAIKRVAVGFSLFHYGTLNVANFLSNKPMHSLESILKTKAGFKRESLLKDPKTGRLSEEAKFQIDNGVTFGIISDSGVGAMDAIAQTADKLIGKVTGKNYHLIYNATEPARKIQKVLDHMTWEITHDGLKYLAAQKRLEMARINHPDIPDAVHMKEIATNINNTFGGLDWFSIAREGNSKFSEKIKMAAYSPEGRMGLQVLMFAPDWTMSTVRAVTHALPKEAFAPSTWDLSQGLQGLLHPLTEGDYSRQYMTRFALTSLTLVNGLNVALSGKYIWENKDPFTIDMGDGTFLSPFKHAAEFYHWLTDFDKTAYNKLGWVPKQLTEAAYDIRKDTPMQERLKNLVKGTAIPFTGSSATDAKRTAGEAALGFVGMPVTGVKNRPMANFERMKKNFERKLGIKIKDDTEDK